MNARAPRVWILLPLRHAALIGCALALAATSAVLLAREAPPPLPLAGKIVAVDAGHGGDDRGVCHFPMGLIEKEINLDIAGRVASGLEAAGAKVLLTRTEDAFVSLDERAEAANAAGADLFLSIHTNRIPGHPECFGAQVFYFPTSEESKRLAETLQAELIAIDPANYRGALPGNYRVLRLSRMPGALVEIGFLTNARDRSLIATDAYRQAVAEAIVSGIIRHLKDAPVDP